MARAIEGFQPDVIMNLAAESHVDRSIDGPEEFIQTNIVGTFTLLAGGLDYWRRLPAARAERFRFQHISTDEVFGSLGPEGLFSETSPYQPNSPYSASKASADHLVRAWRDYKLPTLVTNCSNNYGPYHFPEKLIPLIILNAFEGKPLPVYGKGENVRDWLYVDDHADALLLVAGKGKPGESYNVGSRNERKNIDVVRKICAILDESSPTPRARASGSSPSSRIARATTSATRLIRARSKMSSAGARPAISGSGLPKPCAGISTIASGGAASALASLAANVLVSIRPH